MNKINVTCKQPIDYQAYALKLCHLLKYFVNTIFTSLLHKAYEKYFS